MTSKAVIQKLKRHFSTHGIPNKFMSDNGRQFTSAEFKEFAHSWDFEHITSSPVYPQSNGLAERAVQSAKGLLEKCSRDKSDPYLALLNIRSTPRDGVPCSPAQRLMSRRLRSCVPIRETLLKPKSISNMKVKMALVKKRKQQKQSYDKGSKSLPLLPPNAIVRIETDKGYSTQTATVKEKLPEPRSYLVTSENGKDYRRNRRHLLHVQERRAERLQHLPSDSEPEDPPSPPKLQTPPPERPPVQSPSKLKDNMATPEKPTTVLRSGRISVPNPNTWTVTLGANELKA